MPKKVITDTTLPVVLNMLNTWEDKLTWQSVCDRIEKDIGFSVSRHGLIKYPQIVEAFNERKQHLREQANTQEDKTSNDVTLDYALEQIKQLRAEIVQLEREKKALLDRLVIWQRNLTLMPNVDLDRLNDPLPKVNR